MSKPIRNLVVVSDLHCGCQLGLCPADGMRFDEGGEYVPSKIQKVVWSWWREFWDEWVPEVTRGEPYSVVINGDAIDGRHHHAVSQFTQNLADQAAVAKAILKPVAERAVRFYMIRGTPSHTGPSGEAEEALARELGAVPNDVGQYARWELWIRVGGKGGPLCHIMHHIGSTGSANYESTAPQAEYVAELVEAARARVEPPDFVVRSHRHRSMMPSKLGHKRANGCVVTPAWQLKTPYAFRIAGARIAPPEIGGIVIRRGHKFNYVRGYLQTLERPRVEE